MLHVMMYIIMIITISKAKLFVSPETDPETISTSNQCIKWNMPTGWPI